ncbi:MAG: hypothetical protein A3I72_13275 [Candidatus Tectomicrobia bacterium RIFCSPLOWO2_02_FULL_70_19]|nr:MAG: hypothetical protein A3I72_13275 [Candidatus Tectomicrobia bacterium RIFCSPLOWO2_02_FULL_70_19]
MSPPSETVYYSRRTLVVWCLGLSALWASLFGLIYVSAEQGRVRERASLAAQAQSRGEELIKLRAENRSLQERSAKFLAQAEELLAQVKALAPPELAVEERLFPLGTAVEIVPGRLFLTVGRLESGRARLRLAAVAGGGADLGSRALPPGEPWAFAFAGENYTLLVHELSARPPGAKISIRKNPSGQQ